MCNCCTYLTYDQYLQWGGNLSPERFQLEIVKAERLIDYATHNRIRDNISKRSRQLSDALAVCAYDLLTVASEAEQAKGEAGQAITSFSTDGYSETIAEPMTAETRSAKEQSAINMYLYGLKDDNGTPLLYAGMDA